MAWIYSNLPKVIQEVRSRPGNLIRASTLLFHHTSQIRYSNFRIALCLALSLAGYQSAVNKHILWSLWCGCQSWLML